MNVESSGEQEPRKPEDADGTDSGADTQTYDDTAELPDHAAPDDEFADPADTYRKSAGDHQPGTDYPDLSGIALGKDDLGEREDETVANKHRTPDGAAEEGPDRPFKIEHAVTPDHTQQMPDTLERNKVSGPDIENTHSTGDADTAGNGRGPIEAEQPAAGTIRPKADGQAKKGRIEDEVSKLMADIYDELAEMDGQRAAGQPKSSDYPGPAVSGEGGPPEETAEKKQGVDHTSLSDTVRPAALIPGQTADIISTPPIEHTVPDSPEAAFPKWTPPEEVIWIPRYRIDDPRGSDTGNEITSPRMAESYDTAVRNNKNGG